MLPEEDNFGLTMAPVDPCIKCLGEADGVPEDEYLGVVEPLVYIFDKEEGGREVELETLNVV